MPHKDPEARRAYVARRQRERRAETLVALGGKCAWCGISDARVLQIDHIADDGNQHRAELQGLFNSKNYSLAIWRDVVKRGVTDRYQLLCKNCHTIKTWEDKTAV